jgi:hypothetical protein
MGRGSTAGGVDQAETSSPAASRQGDHGHARVTGVETQASSVPVPSPSSGSAMQASGTHEMAMLMATMRELNGGHIRGLLFY